MATATQTQIGHISRLLQQVETLETPLLRQMNQLGRQLTLVILMVSALVFGLARMRGLPRTRPSWRW